MTNTIFIKGMSVQTRIGIEGENDKEQEILVDVSMRNNCDPARSDDIKDALDYRETVDIIRRLAREERTLIERFAEDIASEIKRNERVEEVRVKISKPRVAEKMGVREIGVEIKR